MKNEEEENEYTDSEREDKSGSGVRERKTCE